MKNYIQILAPLIIGSLFFLTACEYDAVEVKKPKFERKLVVHSFISPSDRLIVLSAAYNQEVFGEIVIKNPDLSRINAWLSDGVKEVQFIQRNDSLIIDSGLFPIQMGKTYTLKASDPEGGSVSASCSIPFYQNYNIQVDTTFIRNPYDMGYSSSLIKFETTISNLVPVKAYYQVVYYYEIYLPDNQPKVRFWVGETSYYNRNSANSLISILDGTDQYHYFSNVDSVFLNLEVFQFSDEYYTYKRSLENYSDEDSYFTEMSPVYTNINGGLGFFGGFTKQEFRMKLNKDMVENK